MLCGNITMHEPLKMQLLKCQHHSCKTVDNFMFAQHPPSHSPTNYQISQSTRTRPLTVSPEYVVPTVIKLFDSCDTHNAWMLYSHNACSFLLNYRTTFSVSFPCKELAILRLDEFDAGPDDSHLLECDFLEGACLKLDVLGAAHMQRRPWIIVW